MVDRFPSYWTPLEQVAAVLARADPSWHPDEGDWTQDNLADAERVLAGELAPRLLAALMQHLYADPPGLSDLRDAIDRGQDQGYHERALPGTNHGRLVLARFLLAVGYVYAPEGAP